MNDEHRVELDVRGMTCGACVRHVRGALEALAGVHGVDVNLRGARATVVCDAHLASGEALVASVRAAGYDAAITRAA